MPLYVWLFRPHDTVAKRRAAKIFVNNLSHLKWCNISQALTTMQSHNSLYQKYLEDSFTNRCWYYGFSHSSATCQLLSLSCFVTVQMHALTLLPLRSDAAQPVGSLQLRRVALLQGQVISISKPYLAAQHISPDFNPHPRLAVPVSDLSHLHMDLGMRNESGLEVDV